MNYLWPNQAPYTVCNSCLSEYGVLGETVTHQTDMCAEYNLELSVTITNFRF